MPKRTKERIIKNASLLFRKQGIANVRLQNIADESNMSIGNLVYHFANKDTIVKAVYHNLFEEHTEILAGFMTTKSLKELDVFIERLYHFFTANPFYVTNIWELENSFPELKAKWDIISKKTHIQIKKRIEYDSEEGYIKPKAYSQEYSLLASSLFLCINFWVSQQWLTKDKSDCSTFKKAFWAMLYPHFTDKGLAEFSHFEISHLLLK